MPPRVQLLVLGTGAGATSVYHGESSSACVLLLEGEPELMLDVVSRQHACRAGFRMPCTCSISAACMPELGAKGSAPL